MTGGSSCEENMAEWTEEMLATAWTMIGAFFYLVIIALAGNTSTLCVFSLSCSSSSSFGIGIIPRIRSYIHHRHLFSHWLFWRIKTSVPVVGCGWMQGSKFKTFGGGGIGMIMSGLEWSRDLGGLKTFKLALRGGLVTLVDISEELWRFKEGGLLVVGSWWDFYLHLN